MTSMNCTWANMNTKCVCVKPLVSLVLFDIASFSENVEITVPSGASKECITGLPAHKCDMKRTSKCYTLLWYLGTWEWHTKICQCKFVLYKKCSCCNIFSEIAFSYCCVVGFRKDYCYTNAVELESCDDVKEKGESVVLVRTTL